MTMEKNTGLRKLPPIGLRILKSAAAVLLCYGIDFLRNGAGIVFYSQLSALWCMQDYTSETKKNAKQRIAGTVIGAVFGLLCLILFHALQLDDEHWSYAMNALVISGSIILIIYTTVLLNKRNASYFSCVVFLSIVVNHTGDANPYLFVLNRVLDTMIGIAIGVGINCISFDRNRNRDILFISGLDDTLLNANNNMSGYSRVELNRMIENGLQFTISTVRTPASLMEPLKDINLKLPVIVMDGAALYNINEKRFEKVYLVPKTEGSQVAQILEEEGIPYFATIVIDDTLLIYYQNTEHEVYNRIVRDLRKSPYRNYINRPVPADESVVYFMAIEKDEVIRGLYDRMMALLADAHLKITLTPSTEYTGFTYMKIYNKNASKEHMLKYLLQQIPVKKVVTFGTIADRYTHFIQPGDTNQVVKIIKKEFNA